MLPLRLALALALALRAAANSAEGAAAPPVSYWRRHGAAAQRGDTRLLFKKNLALRLRSAGQSEEGDR